MSLELLELRKLEFFKCCPDTRWNCIWRACGVRDLRKMRQHENMLATQTALNRLWHCANNEAAWFGYGTTATSVGVLQIILEQDENKNRFDSSLAPWIKCLKHVNRSRRNAIKSRLSMFVVKDLAISDVWTAVCNLEFGCKFLEMFWLNRWFYSLNTFERGYFN